MISVMQRDHQEPMFAEETVREILDDPHSIEESIEYIAKEPIVAMDVR